MTSNADSCTLPSIPEWKALVARFQQPSLPRSVGQLFNTLVPYFALWVAMVWSLEVSYWLTLALSILTGLFVVRAFIIFHDCGHGSFFKSKVASDIVGFITGLITFTPYHHWKWEHSLHHATCSDLDRRGIGDIWTLTVDEYLAAPLWKRFAYRLARNSMVLFIIAPIIMFVIYQRFTTRGANRREVASVWWMNLAVVAKISFMCWLIGWQAYVMIQVPVFVVAGAVGVWMFYIQHQFEDTYWEHREEWDYTAAALKGSSFYKLPKILQWFTGNIGFHHIHHLSSRIPNYNLEPCHNSHPIFQSVKPITFWQSLRCMSLRLWDEEHKKLVGYDYLKQARANRMASAGV